MRGTAILLTTTLLVLATGATAAAVTADVTLRVAPEGFVVPSHPMVGNPAVWIVDPVEETRFNDRDGVAGCQLTVTDTDGDDRIDGAEALDQAADEGCILGWDSVFFDCCGRFVTMVDGLEKQGATETGWPTGWWIVQVDGQATDVGVDQLDLGDGQDLGFAYYTGP